MHELDNIGKQPDGYQQKKENMMVFMTDEEMVKVNAFISILNHNQGSLSKLYSDWQDVEDHYGNEQQEYENCPNTKANIITSTIEGMITQTVDRQIEANIQGVGPEDDSFASTVHTGLTWIFRNNKMRQKVSMHERRRFKFGAAWFKACFDKDYAGIGMAKIMTPPINKIFVDNKIKDFTRLQEAEYICEIVNFSRYYAVQTYGQDKANAIDYGYNEYRTNNVFQESYEVPDDENGWTCIQWWSRYDGKLRLQEFSACGVLLYDSHKAGNRKSNQKNEAYEHRSFYKYVGDDYPYFFTPKYVKEGALYGFGDGKLLLSLQKAINELYDKIRIQMRPNLIAVDISAEMGVNDFDDNSFKPRYYDGNKLGGRPPVHSFPWGSISRDMYEILERLKMEAQRVVRYSDLMTGQAKSADTATEAAIQQQQGNSHINYEKGNVEETIADLSKYLLKLQMEFSKSGKSLAIEDDKKEYEFVDFRSLAEVPVQKPATNSFTKEYTANNPGKEPPKYENVMEKGKPVTKVIELDVYISIGSGLPKNPAFLWSMLEKMSQLMVVDTNEEPPVLKPVVNWSEMRKFVKTFLGLPIVNDDQMKKFIEEYKKIQLAEMKKGKSTGTAMGQVPGGPGPNLPPEGNVEVPGGPGGNQPTQQPETAGLTVGGGGSEEPLNPANVGGIRTGAGRGG